MSFRATRFDDSHAQAELLQTTSEPGGGMTTNRARFVAIRSPEPWICVAAFLLAGFVVPDRQSCAAAQSAPITEPTEVGGSDFGPSSETEVTTVLRRKKTVRESAAAVFVITSEMIRRSGATAVPELLRMVPGMDVARIDNNRWAISARGFNGPYGTKLMVQIDGQTIYDPVLSGVYWENLDYPLADIERIEVVRGPGGSKNMPGSWTRRDRSAPGRYRIRPCAWAS